MTKCLHPELAFGELADAAFAAADAEPLNTSAIGAVQMAVSETQVAEASYDPERYGMPVTQLAESARPTVTTRTPLNVCEPGATRRPLCQRYR